MSEFYPGQRVLCIDGKFHPTVWEWVNEVPIEGEIYTVERVRAIGRDNVTGKFGPALALIEISGRLPGCRSEVCWVIRRFAPVDVVDGTAAGEEKQGQPPAQECLAPAQQSLSLG
jgi:hypothetical protein